MYMSLLTIFHVAEHETLVCRTLSMYDAESLGTLFKDTNEKAERASARSEFRFSWKTVNNALYFVVQMLRKR